MYGKINDGKGENNMARYQVGDRVVVADGIDNYKELDNQVLVVTHVATSRDEHPGYDEGVGQALYDLETEYGQEVSNSLYEYELEGA